MNIRLLAFGFVRPKFSECCRSHEELLLFTHIHTYHIYIYMSRRINNHYIYIYMSIGMNIAPCIALSMSSICFEVVFCAPEEFLDEFEDSFEMSEETEHGHIS